MHKIKRALSMIKIHAMNMYIHTSISACKTSKMYGYTHGMYITYIFVLWMNNVQCPPLTPLCPLQQRDDR